MAKNKGNPKAEYTRKLIEQALFRLLEKEEFSLITIQQIAYEAKISRTSFYRNFSTKEDVFRYTIREKIKTYTSHIEDTKKMMFRPETLIDCWFQDPEFLLLLYKKNLFPLFDSELYIYLRKNIRTYYPEKDESQIRFNDYFALLITQETRAMLEAYAMHGCTESREDILSLISQIQKTLQENSALPQ